MGTRENYAVKFLGTVALRDNPIGHEKPRLCIKTSIERIESGEPVILEGARGLLEIELRRLEASHLKHNMQGHGVQLKIINANILDLKKSLNIKNL